jgi:hypothetical protein
MYTVHCFSTTYIQPKTFTITYLHTKLLKLFAGLFSNYSICKYAIPAKSIYMLFQYKAFVIILMYVLGGKNVSLKNCMM